MTINYYSIGSQDEFLMQIGRVVTVEDHEIAVFCTSDGGIYALENKSPHPKGGPLAEAIVSGHFIYDPLHDWKIDLISGLVQAPDSGKVDTYPVIINEQGVHIGL